MTCVKCNSTMTFREALDFTGEFRKENVTVTMPGYECESCGYRTITGPQMVEFMVRAADAYRRNHQLLTSAEIKRSRDRLGMSQRQFAAYLGVGPASVKRWELGDVQTRVADEIIRLKTDPAYAESLVAEVYRRLIGSRTSADGSGTLNERRGHSRRHSVEVVNVCQELAA